MGTSLDFLKQRAVNSPEKNLLEDIGRATRDMTATKGIYPVSERKRLFREKIEIIKNSYSRSVEKYLQKLSDDKLSLMQTYLSDSESKLTQANVTILRLKTGSKTDKELIRMVSQYQNKELPLTLAEFYTLKAELRTRGMDEQLESFTEAGNAQNIELPHLNDASYKQTEQLLTLYRNSMESNSVVVKGETQSGGEGFAGLDMDSIFSEVETELFQPQTETEKILSPLLHREQ